jgi:hypothetical protein
MSGGLASFLVILIQTALIVIGLLATGELILVLLTMEEHLFTMRQSMIASGMIGGANASRMSAQSLYDQALTASRQNQHQQAVDLFEEAEAAGGQNLPIKFYYYRAQSYRELGENEKAERDMQIYQRKANMAK